MCNGNASSHVSLNGRVALTFLSTSRLEQLSVYINKAADIYALPRLLPTATWGTYQPGNDQRNSLCNPATNRPITIWIIGHIVSVWFAKDGVPDRQGSVTIVPLSTELTEQTGQLLARLSGPTLTSMYSNIG